jgi:AcrR family transcriptional regulator
MAHQLVNPDRRAQRRADRITQNRLDILDAAERVFGQYGIHDGSTRKIAEESGFSSASIYLFFENKQHLLAETLNRRVDDLLGRTRKIAELDLSPLEFLHRNMDATVEFFSSHPYFRLMARHTRGGPTITWPVLAEYAADVHSRYLESMRILSATIGEGQIRGEIRSGNAFALANIYKVLVTEFILMEGDLAELNAETLSSAEFHALIDGALRIH